MSDESLIRCADSSYVPAHLGEAGSRLWAGVASTWELRPDEVRVLTDACREADLVDRLEAELVDAPLTVKGSQGQQVASPLVTEVRQHRTALAGLLRQLHLPDADEGGISADARSAAARAAARVRWDRRTGRGAPA